MGCHVRLHTNEKPWCCPLPSCEYRGRTKNHSKSHVIQNHGTKYFHQYKRFFLQDRCRKNHNQTNPFTIPKSLFKGSSASGLTNSFIISLVSRIVHVDFSNILVCCTLRNIDADLRNQIFSSIRALFFARSMSKNSSPDKSFLDSKITVQTVRFEPSK